MLYLKKTKFILISHFYVGVILYALLIPMIVFDIVVEIYHRTCFPIYGFKYVKRSKFIKIDRQKLKYLRIFQKIGCMYCGYANGVINYWVEIVGLTEYYWCGIQHADDPNFKPPVHHRKFAKYNNKKDFKDKYLDKE